MNTQKRISLLHPVLAKIVPKIQRDIIDVHNIPIRLFETGRTHKRHEGLIQRGKTKDLISRHLYNLENDPPLYSTAVDYVYYDRTWSWNLRDSTIASWYILFGHLVLDSFPELEWGGLDRKSVNYCHFQLRKAVILENIDVYPCVMP